MTKMDEVVRESEITKKLRMLDNEIGTAIEKVDILTEKLAPALRSTRIKDTVEEKKIDSMTALGTKIQEQIDNVHRIIDDLESLIDRLEI